MPRVPFVPFVPFWCAARAPHASRALCDSLGGLVRRSCSQCLSCKLYPPSLCAARSPHASRAPCNTRAHFITLFRACSRLLCLWLSSCLLMLCFSWMWWRWLLFSRQMGNWELSRVPPSKQLPRHVRDRVFTAYKNATRLESDNYKAWHCWAMVRPLSLVRHTALYPLSPVSYPLPPIPCPLSLASYPLSPIPCPPSLRPLSPVPYPMPLTPCVLSPIPCLRPPVPYPLPNMPYPMSTFPCLLGAAFFAWRSRFFLFLVVLLAVRFSLWRSGTHIVASVRHSSRFCVVSI